MMHANFGLPDFSLSTTTDKRRDVRARHRGQARERARYRHGDREPPYPRRRQTLVRKLLIIITTTAALTAVSITPAAAHAGTASFTTLSACKQAREKMSKTHKVTPCEKHGNSYVFKYQH
ncbi:hypothetical protein [Actinophytocola sp.]|uniref:hypothetical protein n=1 Tax=Actinophytocola sp. TaxID=1872138 RepID=UPI002ED6BCA2